MFAHRLAVLFTCSLIACGGSSSIAQADLAAKLSQAACTHLLACCTGVSGAPTEAACEASFTARVQSEIASATASGHTSYDGDAASCAVNDFSTLGCGAFGDSGSNTDCSPVFIGTQANGATCTSGAECKSVLCINIAYTNSNPVANSGTCAAQGTLGQPCPTSTGGASTELCVTGTYESVDSSTLACTCVASLANGSTCDGANYGQCSSGYCDSSTNKCSNPPTLTTLSATYCQAVFQTL